MSSPNHIKPKEGRLEITPASVGWKYLSFKTLLLKAGESVSGNTESEEAALVPLSGDAEVLVGGQTVHLKRKDVFSELPTLIYMSPGTAYTVKASADSHLALGSAPAEGRYPLRVITPDQIKVELRGGANATRQVSHILGPDLPAERLLMYEVYTPSGFWSGWPPHRHDGLKGSLYIEETYYYRINPSDAGWAIHRNYSPEHGLDELLMVKDGDLVLTPVGYHPVSAPPGSNVYYLNYMAGEAQNEQRSIAPVDDGDWAWMRQDWAGKPLKIPFGKE